MTQPPFRQLLGGVGDIAQSGLFRAAVRYWWLSAPLGLWAWHTVQKRRKAGTLTVGGVLTDMAPAVMVVGTLVVLNHTLEEREKTKAAPRTSPIPVGTPVTDAAFTPVPSAALEHPVIANTEVPAAQIPTATPVEDSPYG